MVGRGGRYVIDHDRLPMNAPASYRSPDRRTRRSAAMAFCCRRSFLPAMAPQILSEHWSISFWEHGAVMCELTRHLLDSHHPLPPADVSRSDVSPSTLGLTEASKLSIASQNDGLIPIAIPRSCANHSDQCVPTSVGATPGAPQKAGPVGLMASLEHSVAARFTVVAGQGYRGV